MRRRWLVVAGVSLVTVGLAGLYAWMQSPVTNKGMSVNNEPNNVLSSQIQLVPLDTAYFSTSLPSVLQRKTSAENNSAPVSGMYLFKHKQPNVSDQLAITTGKLSGGILSELSGVKVRQSEPSRYVEVKLSVAPAGAVVFERQDQYETAVFWQHEDRYASVVIGGSAARSPELDATLSAVLTHWQWH